MENILIPVSAGELLDKISILEIKCNRIKDQNKLRNIEQELVALADVRDDMISDAPEIDSLYQELKKVNESLWEIEDNIRQKEASKKFDQDFIQLARQVYLQNDSRARLKKSINLKLKSQLIEEKSYVSYESQT